VIIGSPRQEPEDLLAFYKAEATYWRGEAERLRGTLRRIEQSLGGTNAWVPPEPPIGTQYFVDGGLAWTRTLAGWVCPREACSNCPTDWQELWELIDNSAERVDRLLPWALFNVPDIERPGRS
jgi:hypothetical protein